MKKKDLAKLAIMGMASGLLLQGHLYSNIKVLEKSNDDASRLYAVKAACKGPKGCPDLVAENGKKNTKLKDPSTVPSKSADKSAKTESSDEADKNDENLGYHLLTEDELLLELNDEGAKLYNSLSPEGKQLALKVASQRCQGTNDCKGLNACATDENKCAGQGSCKGKSKCAFSDKNLAVRVVSKKMAEKRNNALGK